MSAIQVTQSPLIEPDPVRLGGRNVPYNLGVASSGQFALEDSPNRAFQALGNAVNCDVVEKVAAALLKSTSLLSNAPLKNLQSAAA